MRGGEFSFSGLTDGFKGLVSKFSPSTDAEKCTKAKEAAQEVCSKVNGNEDAGDIEISEMNPPVDDYAATQPMVANDESGGVGVDDYAATQPNDESGGVGDGVGDGVGVDDYAAIKPVTNDDLGGVGDGIGDGVDDYAATPPPSLSPPLSPPSLSPPPLQPPVINNNVTRVGGGRKKSRRKNKNKKQSRRHKKSKSSRKHKQ